MGFSLLFMRLVDMEPVDVDRVGLQRFLDERGLRVRPNPAGSSGDLVHAVGSTLSFDGQPTDLHLDLLDQPGPVTGGIFHATLTKSELEFIYALCAAGHMMIINPQGPPFYLLLTHIHAATEAPDPEHTTWVGSAEQLGAALGTGYSSFQDYRDHVLPD